ncbi:transposase (plasmid) [Streptomyces sp. NBC_00825]|uniref:transposase n=1 Tax=unclassified Streptomyces TaxID=2593676 RepID=UPI002256D438|nr:MULTISPECIES: transposase [unclassified Streptomyces]WTB59486.1 transposase [Streptomyces sp. NBC_00826]WTH87645.1 transposase [Streptomyces sp. NBC_00825]WTH96371.1 transposase [Streptomyces sp. NBC_00822]MCX4870699.1 transposase [Streptomyces sp. NBC_00906]MCX4901824.1 transposase [Streptomyces sp. NBC_00892]
MTDAPTSRLQLATVCVLQFPLGLSDCQAAEAVRCRIDFKYALAMELDGPGFHHSVLADFRERRRPRRSIWRSCA